MTATHQASTISLRSILFRSLAHRRARSFSAFAALTVSALVATALLTLYLDLDAKLHHEFRSFGANIIVTSPASSTASINAATVARIQQAAGTDAIATPIAYAVAETDRKTPVVVAGVDFATLQRLDTAWKLTDVSGNNAAWPTAANAALIGVKAAGFIANEREVTLSFNGKPITLAGAGRVTTGGDEDSRVYMPLAAFTQWTGVQPSVVELQVPGGAARVNAALAALHEQVPQLNAQPVRALVAGESRIVDRTHLLVFGAMLLIALTVAVSVLSTLSASVLERRRDFALMKALGASQPQLLLHFLLEAIVLATAAVAIGYVLGGAVAWIIGEVNFGTAILPHWIILPLVFVLNIVIAALAALLPARSLRVLQPAALLKGE